VLLAPIVVVVVFAGSMVPVFQPLNTYPVRVGLLGKLTEVPFAPVSAEGVALVPPLRSK